MPPGSASIAASFFTPNDDDMDPPVPRGRGRRCRRRGVNEDEVDARIGATRVLTVPALREGDGRNGREDQRQGDDDVLELRIEPPSGSGGRGSAGTE